MIGACPNHLLNSACRRSAPSIKQRSNLILSGSGSSARRYSSQLASQRHLHLPSAITLTAVSSIGLSPGQPSPCSLISRRSERKVCAGLPPPPLIMRWSMSPVERGTARACLDTLARGVYSLQFPPVIGHRRAGVRGRVTCVDTARAKRLYRFTGSNQACWEQASSSRVAPMRGLANG